MRRRLRTAALPLHRHSLLQLALDGAFVALAYFLAYRLRFDQSIGVPHRYERLFEDTLPWVVAFALVVFTLFRIEQKQWRYTTQRDYTGVLQAVAVLALAVVGFVALAHPVTVPSRSSGQVNLTIPTGVMALFVLLTLAFVGGGRFLARAIYERPIRGFRAAKGARRVLIVGAGDGGRLTLREVLRNPALDLDPVGFVDDDPLKLGVRIDGVKVLGATDALGRILDETEPDEILIAIPSAPGTLRARVVRAGRQRGIPVRTLPTVFELLQAGSGHVVRQVREVQVEDILGREPVRMEIDRVGAYLSGEVVMVTGAGGSIGSELCRQIARVAPRRLVLLDHAEDNLFAIQRELEDDRHVHPSALAAVLADCKEGERMREVLEEHRPSVIFHAAAYKHVGLMEANPVEAVRNNALATRLVARLAGECGVKAFVLVSTDKAVSPATVMGASKALAEYAVEEMSARFAGTRYATVRFGNVLGSSGSVVPIFRRQIARGGPLTVTDERMTRYFMTIPEAVQLIIRSGSLGKGGEIFVLEMGEPVSILELARDMIELSGLRADKDIAIEVVGRRPGEKLHEELFNPQERPQPTPAEKILLAGRRPRDPAEVAAWFDEISLLVLEGDAAGLAAKVEELAGAGGASRAASGEGAF
ncbi:MAG TPA: nucleoside-diphosphate sugar epimerase/dehydratase [Solirubrobacteraceae bacterium]|nr:nucleoside-diphosphate sugar epimerase/dehydratase [Solirubrobacteraceae bacterium]